MKTIVCGLLLALCASTAAHAADTVLRVVTVETSDTAAYVAQLQRGQAIMKKANSPATIRVWRATFAGPNAGSVVVSVEYPSLTAFAADNEKLGANSEFQAWLKGLDAVRTIVSDSLYNEL